MKKHSAPLRASLRNGSVEGNERLTALVAGVLLLTLFLVGLSIPLANSQTRLHVFLGVVVIPPVLLKIASTTWRFMKYYAGNFSYRRKGPPIWPLRLLGPILTLLTLVVLFSGVGLVWGAPSSWRPHLSQVHHLSFIVWFVATTVHVLAHLRQTVRTALLDVMRRTRQRVKGSRRRVTLALLSVALGVACGALIMPYVGH